jgi:hypothetical protein
MRSHLVFAASLIIASSSPLFAQISPYGNAGDNLGSWSWDKSKTKNSNGEEEHEPGESSWERLQAERKAEEAELTPKDEQIKSLSPLELWRLWRGGKKEDGETQ